MKVAPWIPLTVCLAALAGWGASAPAKDRNDKSEKSTSPERRAQLRERIHTVRMVRLVEDLDLDEQKAMAISKILKEYEKQKDEIGQKRRQQMETLKKAVSEAKPDEKNVSEADLQKGIDAVLKLDDDLRGLQKTEYADVAAHLTPVQRAKYLMFRQEFNQAVGDVLRHGRGRDNESRGGSNNRSRRDRDEGRESVKTPGAP